MLSSRLPPLPVSVRQHHAPLTLTGAACSRAHSQPRSHAGRSPGGSASSSRVVPLHTGRSSVRRHSGAAPPGAAAQGAHVGVTPSQRVPGCQYAWVTRTAVAVQRYSWHPPSKAYTRRDVSWIDVRCTVCMAVTVNSVQSGQSCSPKPAGRNQRR